MSPSCASRPEIPASPISCISVVSPGCFIRTFRGSVTVSLEKEEFERRVLTQANQALNAPLDP